MKKTYSIGADARTSDSLEITRRLYRNITEIAKKLEEQKSRALTVIDIFTPSGEALRSKLRDYCERLIVDDPINHVQKTEELLWRRGFYDIVSAAKKLRKGNSWNEMEKAFLSAHLSVGVGFYHHLILRLQLEYNLNLLGVIDFAYPLFDKGVTNVDKNVGSSKVHTAEAKKCISHFIHRSLICLGDLARYRLDLDPHWDPQISRRYYKMAIAVDNKYGMPHNQLGTVASNKNYGLDAVYYYMRSILCLEPFEGAEGNLKRTIIIHSLNGKEKSLTQSCIARLLLLLQLWDNSSLNNDRINQESQTLINNIENCLNVDKSDNIDHEAAKNEDSIEKYLSYYKNDENNYLTDNMIFKIIVICLMKIMKMQMKECNETHGVTAFILAVFSQLLQFVVMRLQESLLDMSMSNKNYEFDKTNDINEIVENDNNSENKVTNDNEKDLKEETLKNNDLNSVHDNANNEINGNHINGKVKKLRDKSKSLLTKLRRPRKRRNSSDSEGSDGEGVALGSSSEDINSDITETEEDIMSDENILTDEALSEDLTDDEKNSTKENNIDDSNIITEQVNGLSKMEEKIVEENENKAKDIENVIENIKENEYESKDNTATDVTNTFDENNASAKTLTYVAQMEKQNLDAINVLKVLSDEKMLISIKVCCDWLYSHKDIIKTCAKGSKTLLKRLITLLNLINLDIEKLLKKQDKDLEIFSSLQKVKEAVSIIPLPEDIDLKGLSIFDHAHKNIDWEILNRKNITNSEETLLRTLKIVEFGHHLCTIQESGVSYDNSKSLFIINEESTIVKENQNDSKTLELDQTKGNLMRHMGRLWLKAEVRALESRLHHRLMSPYLVPDHEAFSKFMPLLKNLVYAKKFILVIPSVVVSALDELKKISSHAREATRWLEAQLQRGSRFLRAQRPHEKLPLPFIKGPKPKDKEAWLYFQIIECCHYLTQQSKAGDTEIPVVTLLTGIDDKKSFSFSPDGLTKSAGVNFEHIGAFHAKWKSSIKSYG